MKHHKFVYIGLVGMVLILAGAFNFNKNDNNSTSQTTTNKPKVVDFFACGDYCPGPQEKYMIKIYEGVKDETQCRNLGGRFSSFTGWGTTYYCATK